MNVIWPVKLGSLKLKISFFHGIRGEFGIYANRLTGVVRGCHYPLYQSIERGISSRKSETDVYFFQFSRRREGGGRWRNIILENRRIEYILKFLIKREKKIEG